MKFFKKPHAFLTWKTQNIPISKLPAVTSFWFYVGKEILKRQWYSRFMEAATTSYILFGGQCGEVAK